jgi:hypothetical protein
MAVLALVSQLALGTMVLPEDASSADAELAAVSILCQTGSPVTPVPGAPRRQHMPDCPVCPLCIALATQGAMLTPTITLPMPSIQRVAQIALPPPARGPPSRPLRISLARGPPVLT